MKRRVVLAMLLRGVLSAQDIAGDWQGTLKLSTSAPRLLVSIANAPGGGWTATESTPDDGSNPIAASTVTFDGSTLKIAFDRIRAT